MAEAYIGEHVLVGHPADWASPPILRLEHRSEITSASSGGEGRATQWHARRRRLRYVVTGLDGRACGRIEETLRVAQEAKAAAVPYWHALRQVVGVAGPALHLSAAIPVALARAQVIWWHEPMTGETGTATVEAAQGTLLTLQEVPEDLVAGAVVAPILLGTIESIRVTELHGSARSYTIEFSEAIGSASGTARSVEESLVFGIGHDGGIENLSPERDAPEHPLAFGLALSGSYQAVVVGLTARELQSFGVGLSGTYAEIALLRPAADSGTLGLTLSGNYQ